MKKDSPSQATAKIAIQYATARYIRNDPLRAQRIADVTAQIRSLASSDAASSVDGLRDVIASHLPSTLKVEERIAINALTDLVMAELQARLGDNTLSEDVVLVLDTLAGWIIDVTEWYPPLPEVVLENGRSTTPPDVE